MLQSQQTCITFMHHTYDMIAWKQWWYFLITHAHSMKMAELGWNPVGNVTVKIYLFWDQSIYDGIDFILEVREVRLQFTHIELGYILNYCIIVNILALDGAGVYLQMSPPYSSAKEMCPQKTQILQNSTTLVIDFRILRWRNTRHSKQFIVSC